MGHGEISSLSDETANITPYQTRIRKKQRTEHLIAGRQDEAIELMETERPATGAIMHRFDKWTYGQAQLV